MQKKECGDRGAHNARPYPHAVKHTAERAGIVVYRIPQGKEYNDNLRAVCKTEIINMGKGIWGAGDNDLMGD